MGSRDAVREAFQKGLIADGEGWIEMIQSRNQTSHTYNQTVADEIVEKVTARYCELFLGLENELLKLKERGKKTGSSRGEKRVRQPRAFNAVLAASEFGSRSNAFI
jgi:hypothetical protein